MFVFDWNELRNAEREKKKKDRDDTAAEKKAAKKAKAAAKAKGKRKGEEDEQDGEGGRDTAVGHRGVRTALKPAHQKVGLHNVAPGIHNYLFAFLPSRPKNNFRALQTGSFWISGACQDRRVRGEKGIQGSV